GAQVQAILLEPPIRKGTGKGSQRLRLVLTTKLESQLNLYSRIGFEYNRKRSSRAALAVQYLKHKRKHLEERAAAHRRVRAFAGAGSERQRVLDAGTTPNINRRSAERSLAPEKEFQPRVDSAFPTFEEYCAANAAGSTPGGMVWERVASVEPVE